MVIAPCSAAPPGSIASTATIVEVCKNTPKPAAGRRTGRQRTSASVAARFLSAMMTYPPSSSLSTRTTRQLGTRVGGWGPFIAACSRPAVNGASSVDGSSVRTDQNGVDVSTVTSTPAFARCTAASIPAAAAFLSMFLTLFRTCIGDVMFCS